MMEELPPPFICVICQREIEATPWDHPGDHCPPLCRSCGTITKYRGYGVHAMRRMPGMTRGDHRKIQRLLALSDALARETYRGKFAL